MRPATTKLANTSRRSLADWTEREAKKERKGVVERLGNPGEEAILQRERRQHRNGETTVT